MTSQIEEDKKLEKDRGLRITSEDDLWLSRYSEAIPIQSEPDSDTTHQRREKILVSPVSSLRSPSLHRRGDPPCSPLRLPAPPPTSPLSISPYSLSLEEETFSFGQQEEDGAWGEGLGLSLGTATPPSLDEPVVVQPQPRRDSLPNVPPSLASPPPRATPSAAEDPYSSPYRRSRSQIGGSETPSPSVPIPIPISQLTTPRTSLVQMATFNAGQQSEKVATATAAVQAPTPLTSSQRRSLLTTSSSASTVSAAVAAASTQAADFDWNKQFQNAMEAIGRLTLNSHPEDRLAAYQKLSQLAADFSYTVRTYARIIISEVYLPKEQKTIKPVETMGGVAGGDKYVVHKIVFKFALDNKGFYGGDECAAKVANHDLKSLAHILNCWEPGIQFPMMALVDYRGFRVVGMTLLPINGLETLVHGSRDAGKTIRTSTTFEERLRRIASKLNLKGHLVGEEGYMFYTPVDLEGHIGTDGKNYIVDFSRLFPPQSLSPVHKLGHLYQLLRPEFVRNYRIPLCSDTYSQFVCPDPRNGARAAEAAEHEQEIEEATQYLVESVVPAFAHRLLQTPPERREGYPLILLMHEIGINTRYLGLLHEQMRRLGDDYWCLRLVVEMAARVIKNDVRALLRRKVRELLLPGEGAYRSAVIAHLNLVFGSSPATVRHWSSSVAQSVAAKFPPFAHSGKLSLLTTISRNAQRLGLTDGRCLLFKEVARMLGLRFASPTWQDISANSRAFDRYQPFTDTDLKEMRERVKEMNIAAHSAGFMLKVKAKMTSNAEERRRLLSLAVQQFQHALEGNPDNKVTLRNLGECLASLERFEDAQDCYTRALQAGPSDTTTLYKYAIALDKMGRLDEAEDYFLRSLEACVAHSNCCLFYADFLGSHRKNFDDAERFYLRALEIDPSNRSAANNYAVFLCTVKRDHDRAEQFFLRAITGGRNITHINNYAAFLLHIRRNPEAAAVYTAKAQRLRISAKWS